MSAISSAVCLSAEITAYAENEAEARAKAVDQLRLRGLKVGTSFRVVRAVPSHRPRVSKGRPARKKHRHGREDDAGPVDCHEFGS
jgi:hypothetical protein